jgi:hypothetical protein
MELYPAINKNGNMSFTGKWMELKIIMLISIGSTQTNAMRFLSYAESRFKTQTT